AAAIGRAVFGGPPADWAPRAEDAALLSVVRDRHGAALDDPFDLLCRLGGFELAAIVGAILPPRLGRTPALLARNGAAAAPGTAWPADRRGVDHCQAAHAPATPAHRRLLEGLGKTPVLDLGVAETGVASGLAVTLLRTAAACHAEPPPG